MIIPEIAQLVPTISEESLPEIASALTLSLRSGLRLTPRNDRKKRYLAMTGRGIIASRISSPLTALPSPLDAEGQGEAKVRVKAEAWQSPTPFAFCHSGDELKPRAEREGEATEEPPLQSLPIVRTQSFGSGRQSGEKKKGRLKSRPFLI